MPPAMGATRWSEMSKALNTFIAAPENAGLGAGIGFFPRPSMDGTNVPRITCQEPDARSPMSEMGVLPAVAGAIATSIMQQTPGGSTPTVPSITAALKYAAQHQAATPSRRTALVYATDGIPQGCSQNTVDRAAMAAASALMTSSIPTYVLGVGPQLDSLNQIAMSGGTTRGLPSRHRWRRHRTARGRAARHQVDGAHMQLHDPMSSAGPIDPDQVNVIAKVGDMGTQTLIGQVPDKAGCDAAGGGWYYSSGNTIISLCTTTCNPLLATPNSHLQVLIGCATQGQPVESVVRAICLLLRDDFELERRGQVAEKLGGDVVRSRGAHLGGDTSLRSISMPFSLSAVATSLVVTDPKSRSSSPTLRSSFTTTLDSFSACADCFGASLGRARQRDALLVLDLMHVLDGGRHRERAGEQVVARVAGANADEIAALAQVFQVLLEDHLNCGGHDEPP